jgi:hypothetical protein
MNHRIVLSSIIAAALAACAQDVTTPRRTPDLSPNELATSRDADLSDAALLVGNFNPGGLANGILRYNAATGAFIDRFVPEGRGGLTVSCCPVFGPDENLYVGSPFTSSVLRFNGVTGEFIDEFVPPHSGGLGLPVEIMFGPDGNLYVGDFGPDFGAANTSSVRRYNGTTGAFIDQFIPAGSQGITFPDPQSIAFGPDGNFYLASPATNRVLRYDGHTGAFIDAFVSPGAEGQVGGAIAFDRTGRLYVGTAANGVNRYGTSGAFIDRFVAAGSGGLLGPTSEVFASDGTLYVASTFSGSVLRFDGSSGHFIDAVAPAGRGGIDGPRIILLKERIQVCHHADAPTKQHKTITIGYLSAADHVRHGDTVGGCP